MNFTTVYSLYSRTSSIHILAGLWMPMCTLMSYLPCQLWSHWQCCKSIVVAECSTYCPNQLFEGATATTVFVFSSLQAITAKHQKFKGLFPSLSVKIQRSTQILRNRYGHAKRSATFDYPIWPLGLWQGRETSLSTDFSRTAGKQRLMTVTTFGA